MPTVVVKTGGTHQFGSPGEAAEFLDLFLEKAGFVKEYRWEARLEKTAHCSWDSPPARVVGYKHWVIYLRVKPSINATVDHFVSLLIPDGSGYAAETVYKQLKIFVKPFNRFVRTNGHRKKGLEPAMTHDAIPAILSPLPCEPCVFGENDLAANHTLESLTPLVEADAEFDAGLLLIRFREKAQELADAGRRLETNRDKHRSLQAEMKLLDDEYHEITNLLLTNRESSVLLSRLLDIQNVTPIKT